MKKLLIIMMLILIANPMFAGKRSIRSKTITQTYKSYRVTNQELRKLGFKLLKAKSDNYFICEREVRDKIYQVHVKLYRKKIKLDVYCFNPVKKQWRSKKYGEDVMTDIYKAIIFRIENNTSIPQLSLPAFWGVVRNNEEYL